MSFKEEDELVSIRTFVHDPEEEVGHDQSQVRDVLDSKGEGQMLKMHKDLELDDDEDYEPPEEIIPDDLSPWIEPPRMCPVEFVLRYTDCLKRPILVTFLRKSSPAILRLGLAKSSLKAPSVRLKRSGRRKHLWRFTLLYQTCLETHLNLSTRIRANTPLKSSISGSQAI